MDGKPPLIRFVDLWKSFGAQPVLRGLTLEAGRGEVLFIVGTSGVGKSVTIKHVVGLLRPDRGEVWFDGRRVDTLDERELAPIRRRCAMVFQAATLFDSMTLVENVALPLRKHKRLRGDELEAEARRRLSQVHLDAFADRLPSEVGDGVKKRAAIARALTLDPEAILFDEPTTGLDPVSARRIDALIRELADTLSVTAVVVSHDLVSINNIADRVALVYRGVAHAVGPPAALAASDDPVLRQFFAGASVGPMDTPGF
jgi:phospholipid/cholesterol/gamma-HCH transport system ATP-binding protein